MKKTLKRRIEQLEAARPEQAPGPLMVVMVGVQPGKSEAERDVSIIGMENGDERLSIARQPDETLQAMRDRAEAAQAGPVGLWGYVYKDHAEADV